jgi:hypothetical protein
VVRAGIGSVLHVISGLGFDSVMRYRSKNTADDFSRDVAAFINLIGEGEYRRLLVNLGARDRDRADASPRGATRCDMKFLRATEDWVLLGPPGRKTALA